MNERQYYHAALECALLDSESLEKQISARIARISQSKEVRIRFPKRLIIALIAAALLLISSAAVAAVVLRNQSFKRDTNAALEETIETVTQPLNVETHEGWQPNQLILHNNVQGICEEVMDTFPNGRIQLAELYFSKVQWLTATFWVYADKDAPHSLSDLTVTVDDDKSRGSTFVDAVDFYFDGHFQANVGFAVGTNPFWPGTAIKINGKIDGEEFELNYTFSEESYEHMRQAIVSTVQQHESIVNAIPDEGSAVGYHCKHFTLAEVAVANNSMYFTVVNDPGDWMDKTQPPYSEYDVGLWVAIDGRISDFYYLGALDMQNEDGTVYSSYLPYTEDMLPQESLISFMGVVFRYEWATGKVAVPQSNAEYEAWRTESKELSEPYFENDWIWQLEGKGEDFTVTDLIFHNRSLCGEIGIVLWSEQLFDAGDIIDTSETAPIVTIDGIPLKHLGEVDPLENIHGGVSRDRHRKGYMMVGCATADLPETFTLTVTWHGSTVKMQLKRSDVRIEENGEKAEPYYQEVFGY